MSDVKTQVEALVREAARRALGADGDIDPIVRPAKDPRFGDYQANLAMALGKQLKRKPRDLAEAIKGELGTGEPGAEVFAKVEVAGPGFINLTLDRRYVETQLRLLLDDERLGVPLATDRQTVVVDYSSPNLAKEMHIGHLRSTAIGDAIGRVLEFRGDTVIRQNHLGDWGTAFGMLLEYLLDSGWNPDEDHSISDLNELYQTAKHRFDEIPEFANRARQRVVKLQAGDEASLKLWRQLIEESVNHMNSVYSLLGVRLRDEDIRPESFYNDQLSSVVTDLRAHGSLQLSNGAQVVYPAGFKNKDGDPLPLIVQKSDGGFGYAATDLAAIRYRTAELKATRIIYVVDSRQTDHFNMVFWAVRNAGWAERDIALDYVPFGTILGKDKKPFKTRDGGTVRLVDVLTEAEQRARAAVEEKSKEREFSNDVKLGIARAVGIGAVKYADLSGERIKDYVFDWDRMLSLEGNTAPYLQYAYARAQSILRKAGTPANELSADALRLAEPQERALATLLLRLPQVISSVADSLEPHRLCGYLYELASAFHDFHRSCRVISDDKVVQASRLTLCHLVARTLRHCLNLLGIEAPEQM